MAAVVLLIDDDEALPLLVEQRLAKQGCDTVMRFVNDGQEGIDYLSRQGRYADPVRFPWPSVVLLDLRMPRVNGFEVLDWRRNQSELKPVPVVVWSSSGLPQDRESALKLGAEDFLEKPMGLAELVETIRKVAEAYQNSQD